MCHVEGKLHWFNTIQARPARQRRCSYTLRCLGSGRTQLWPKWSLHHHDSESDLCYFYHSWQLCWILIAGQHREKRCKQRHQPSFSRVNANSVLRSRVLLCSVDSFHFRQQGYRGPTHWTMSARFCCVVSLWGKTWGSETDQEKEGKSVWVDRKEEHFQGQWERWRNNNSKGLRFKTIPTPALQHRCTQIQKSKQEGCRHLDRQLQATDLSVKLTHIRLPLPYHLELHTPFSPPPPPFFPLKPLLKLESVASLFSTQLNPAIQYKSSAINPTFMKLIMFTFCWQCLREVLIQPHGNVEGGTLKGAFNISSTEHYKLHRVTFYSRAVVLVCTGFCKVYIN